MARCPASGEPGYALLCIAGLCLGQPPTGWQAVIGVTRRKDFGRAVMHKGLSTSETAVPVSD